MDNKQELINDLGVILRDYSSGKGKSDTLEQIDAVSYLLADLVMKAELPMDDMKEAVNPLTSVDPDRQREIVDELDWRREQISLCSELLGVIGTRLLDLGRLTLENALEISERLMVSGYLAAKLSREEIDTRWNDALERFRRK